MSPIRARPGCSDNSVRPQRRYKYKIVMGQRCQHTLRDCFRVLLMTFAILQLVSGMIFAAIHVVLTFSPSELTYDLQNPLPIYLSAVVVALSGLCQMVLSKLQNSYMILTGIFFSITSCVVSLAGLLSASTVALPKFTSFVRFHYYSTLQLCVAYTRWDKQPNGSFTGGIMFEGLSSCSVVESTLPPLTLALVVFYAISCTTSFISCFVLSTILCLPDTAEEKEGATCKKHSPKKAAHDDAMASSYINYGLELDDICEIVADERAVIPAERSGKTNAVYLPGVGMPYNTLPYRLSLNQCLASRLREGGGRNMCDTHHGHTSCVCKCRVVNILTSCENPVVSSSIQPSTVSATCRPHRNPRPVLPVGFRRSTDDHRQHVAADQSSAMRDRCRRSDERPLCVAVSSASQNNRRRRQEEPAREPRQRVAISVDPSRAHSTTRGIAGAFVRPAGRSGEDSAQSSTSPPPYTELPAYDHLDEVDAFNSDRFAETHACETSNSRASVETLL